MHQLVLLLLSSLVFVSGSPQTQLIDLRGNVFCYSHNTWCWKVELRQYNAPYFNQTIGTAMSCSGNVERSDTFGIFAAALGTYEKYDLGLFVTHNCFIHFPGSYFITESIDLPHLWNSIDSEQLVLNMNVTLGKIYG